MKRMAVIQRDLDWCAFLNVDPMKPCSGCKGCLTPTARDDHCNGTRYVPRMIEDIMQIHHTRMIDKATEIARSLGANADSMHVRLHDSRQTGWK